MTRPTLASLVPLDDLDTAVDQLLDMDEAAFDHAVIVWLLAARAGAEVMYDTDVVERTYETLRRLDDRLALPDLTAELGLPGEDLDRLRNLVPEERGWTRQLAHEARAYRAGTRGGSLTSRAYKELAKQHPREFIAIKRALRAADEVGGGPQAD